MRKLICRLFGHKWRKLLFTQVCQRCRKAEIMDETMDQFVPGWNNRAARWPAPKRSFTINTPS